METTIDNEIRRDPRLDEAVRMASDVLREVVENIKGPPAVAWHAAKFEGTVPRVELALRDEDDSVRQELSLHQLLDRDELRWTVLTLCRHLYAGALSSSASRLYDALHGMRCNEDASERQLQEV